MGGGGERIFGCFCCRVGVIFVPITFFTVDEGDGGGGAAEILFTQAASSNAGIQSARILRFASTSNPAFSQSVFFFFFDSLSSGFFPLSLQLRKEFESVGLAHECPGCPVSINVPSSSKPEVVLLDLMYFADEVYIYIYIINPSSAVCLIYAS